jgi:hypothetical protein
LLYVVSQDLIALHFKLSIPQNSEYGQKAALKPHAEVMNNIDEKLYDCNDTLIFSQ